MTRKIRFEEKRVYNAGSGYVVPNESMEALSALIKNQRYKNAITICSGGEVAYQVLLPKVTGKIILIDHATGSLGWAILKLFMVLNFSYNEIQSLVNIPMGRYKIDPATNYGYYTSSPEQQRFFDWLREVIDDIPAVCQPNFQRLLTPNLKVPSDGIGQHQINYPNQMRPYWEHVDVDVIARMRERVEDLIFVHGDFRDAADLVKADIVYLSNAMEHGAYDSHAISMTSKGVGLTGETIAPCLLPGASILFTGTDKLGRQHYTTVEMLQDPNTFKNAGGWNYYHVRYTPQR